MRLRTVSQVSRSAKANPTFTYNGSQVSCSACGSGALLERSSGLPRRNRFEILMIISALRWFCYKYERSSQVSWSLSNMSTDISSTMGAIYIGATVATACVLRYPSVRLHWIHDGPYYRFWGITAMQSMTYFSRFPNDWWFYRFAVRHHLLLFLRP